jgi:hypothetical protein
MKTSEQYAEAKAEERRKLIRHLDGCPQDRNEESRRRTPDGRDVRVIRCCDCGRQSTSFDGGSWSYE